MVRPGIPVRAESVYVLTPRPFQSCQVRPRLDAVIVQQMDVRARTLRLPAPPLRHHVAHVRPDRPSVRPAFSVAGQVPPRIRSIERRLRVSTLLASVLPPPCSDPRHASLGEFVLSRASQPASTRYDIAITSNRSDLSDACSRPCHPQKEGHSNGC